MTLSPHYRQDSTEGLDPSIQRYLDDRYLSQLVHLEKKNPKLLVVFSGGNAVGKSTLSQKIADRFGGIILENDAVKRELKSLLPDAGGQTFNQITWQYTQDLYKRLPELTHNGLIIRDGVIDWYYDRILPLFQENGYELFIIAYDLKEATLRRLIDERGDTPTFTVERAHMLLEDHAIHQRRFRLQYRPDIVLSEETLFDHESVLRELEKRLHTM